MEDFNQLRVGSLEVCVSMLVDKVKDWGSPWLFCALHVSQEGEPEETAESHVDGPQSSGDKFEVYLKIETYNFT